MQKKLKGFLDEPLNMSSPRHATIGVGFVDVKTTEKGQSSQPIVTTLGEVCDGTQTSKDGTFP